MKSACKNVLAEAVIVVVAGLAVALAANQLSPQGLVLTRNYFPAGTNPARPSPKPIPVASTPEAANDIADAEQLSARLRDKGLQEIKRPQVETVFHGPLTREGRIIFVDARDQEHFQEGHLPGAYELDPYHPEKELGTVLPVCQGAEQVVVYCTGGECEDADTAALLLRDGGVPLTRIFVYGGGYAEWSAAHLPLETGARNSGTAVKSP